MNSEYTDGEILAMIHGVIQYQPDGPLAMKAIRKILGLDAKVKVPEVFACRDCHCLIESSCVSEGNTMFCKTCYDRRNDKLRVVACMQCQGPIEPSYIGEGKVLICKACVLEDRKRKDLCVQCGMDISTASEFHAISDGGSLCSKKCYFEWAKERSEKFEEKAASKEARQAPLCVKCGCEIPPGGSYTIENLSPYCKACYDKRD